MQQLTYPILKNAVRRVADTILFDLPLPATPAATQTFIKQFCQTLTISAGKPEWGADRMQVMLTAPSFQCLLCMEWLCEGIWIETVGGTKSDISEIWARLFADENETHNKSG